MRVSAVLCDGTYIQKCGLRVSAVLCDGTYIQKCGLRVSAVLCDGTYIQKCGLRVGALHCEGACTPNHLQRDIKTIHNTDVDSKINSIFNTLDYTT